MFFVTAIRGKRVGFLAGPFADHDAALALVEPVRKLACQIDPWCDFDAFGTARSEDRVSPGILNSRLGYSFADDSGAREHTLPSRALAPEEMA